MSYHSRGNFNNNRGGRRRYGGGGGGGRRNRPRPNLNIADFILRSEESAGPVQVEEIKHRFEDFGLNPQLLENVKRLGFETPTPIQDQTIPAIMAGRDVIGLANTGTGKTGAFLIPLINKVLADPKQKTLVIAPTRELAMQIDEALRLFKKGLRIWSVLCIGGTSTRRQMQDLRKPHDFVVGTPGRLKDMAQQRALDLSSFTTVVLDEVDRMMDMGFLPECRLRFMR